MPSPQGTPPDARLDLVEADLAAAYAALDDVVAEVRRLRRTRVPAGLARAVALAGERVVEILAERDELIAVVSASPPTLDLLVPDRVQSVTTSPQEGNDPA